MKFDTTTLKAGQRWRVHYLHPFMAKYDYEFTLVNLAAYGGHWMVKNHSTGGGVVAYINWWKDQNHGPDGYIMVLVCGNADIA